KARRCRCPGRENRIVSCGQRRFRETLANGFLDAIFLLGTETTAIDQPLHGVEQFEPILQRRFRHRLPLVIAALAGEEPPLPADVLDIDLQLDAVLVDPLPAYL